MGLIPFSERAVQASVTQHHTAQGQSSTLLCTVTLHSGAPADEAPAVFAESSAGPPGKWHLGMALKVFFWVAVAQH